MTQYITGSGDITNPLNWQDIVGGAVPPLEFNAVPTGTAYPNTGDGRYWWAGNAANSYRGATILMHMDGTNGSTSFPDSSNYAHVFAHLGSGATVSNAQIKFGTGSYLQSGISDMLYLATPTECQINNGANWTIEAFVYCPTSLPPASQGCIFSISSTSGNHPILFQIDSGSQSVKGLVYGSGGNIVTITDGTGTMSPNRWYHVAFVRNGNVYTLYRDGVPVGTTTTSSAVNSSNAYVGVGGLTLNGSSIGQSFSGYIDELRFTNGTAVYTGAFTPPTLPFGGIGSKAIQFIGDATREASGSMALQWQITQYSADGSVPYLQYSTNGGTTVTQTALGGGSAPQSGSIIVPLAGATGLQVGVVYLGGTSSGTAVTTNVALAITRNKAEGQAYDYPNPFDPLGYNSARADTPGYLTATLATLRVRLLRRLGFSNQAANPPPGMAELCNEFLSSAQSFLYRRYTALHMRRFFRWKMVPGQRFYSLTDNDEDILGAFKIDPVKPIEWAGVQDTRNVWYPIDKGIPPTFYTMIQNPWRPARYDIRGGIEIFPAPDQTYWLWLRGFTGLGAFASDSDTTSIDSELVFLHALANAKAHYGQPDANNIEAQANAYRGELIAGTHETGHYIPNTTPVPPAVRPTLINFVGS